MNDAMMKPVLNFQRILLFLIIGLTANSHAFAMPVWQSAAKKSVTPDPYFNPRFNGNDIKSNAAEAKGVSPIPRNLKSEFTTPVQKNSLMNAPESAATPNQSVWQPPRTPVIVKANGKENLAAKITKINSIPPNKNPLEPNTQFESGSHTPKQPSLSSKTIIREQRDLSPDQIVSNDFSAAIIGRPPTGRHALKPAKSPSTAAENEASESPLQMAGKHAVSDFLAETGTDDQGGFKNPSTTNSPSSNTLTAVADKQVSTAPNVEAFEPTRLLAKVGGEPIFVGDVLFEVNQMIERFMGNAPESLKAAERKKIVTKILPKFIDSRMLYLGTLDLLPEGADVDTILEQAGKEFDDKALPRMMDSAGIKTANEFDAQLRAQGSSLRKMRLSWSQDQLTKYFLSQQLDADSEVTHQEMLDNYRGRMTEYAISAKSKWEQVMIRFDRAGSRDEAKKQVAELANQIVYGANLAAIAKKSSHGFRAADGGQHDWTSKGALVLKELDEAIFSLPVGELSDVIETSDGFHVIRVLERTDSTHKPFLEAQVDIKKQLLAERRDSAFKKHLEKLRDQIPVEYF
jgi:hypothetical protein